MNRDTCSDTDKIASPSTLLNNLLIFLQWTAWPMTSVHSDFRNPQQLDYVSRNLSRFSQMFSGRRIGSAAGDLLSFIPSVSYYPRGLIISKGNSPNSKIEWDRGVSVPGTFKLDHLQPVEPILFWKFSYFSTFILGSHFLLPQRANNQKREFSQLQNWMRQRGFSAWGIQTGPFAAPWATFVLKIFQLFHFHTGQPFLITPGGQ